MRVRGGTFVVFGAFFCAAIGCFLSGARASNCPNKPELAPELGTWFEENIVLSKATSLRKSLQSPFPGQTVNYYRVKLVLEQAVPHDWYFTIRDKDFRVLTVLGPQDFSASAERWTSRLFSPTLIFDLSETAALQASASPQLRIKIPEAFAMPERNNEERSHFSLQDPTRPAYKSLYEFQDNPDVMARVRSLGDPVGFITAIGVKGEQNVSWCCSGVLLTSDLFLTNWHCGAPPDTQQEVAYWHHSTCGTTMVDLSWDGDLLSRDYSCAKVEAKSDKLDYAILRLASALGSGGGSTARPATVSNGQISGNEGLHIVHHPECFRKQLSKDCQVRNAAFPNWKGPVAGETANREFSHDCDTEGGSSGSPIFNAKGHLVGIHHLGFSVDPRTCQPADKENKAVRLEEILHDVKSQNAQLFQEIKAKGIFAGE